LDLSILRKTAAEIAAAALYELFPDVELWGGGVTPSGFFYDFRFSHPIHEHQIEEKMRQIIKERRPIHTLEMVAFSASELLKKEGHTARLEELDELDGELVELIQIGSFYDLSEGPHLKNTAELAAFKIELEELSNKSFRIKGSCHVSKEEHKQFLKKLASYVDPQEMGERMGFWKGDVWLAAGLKAKRSLIDFLKKHLGEGAAEVAVLSEDRLETLRKLNHGKVVEVRSLSAHETAVETTFFNQSEQEVKSCLQSIGKTLTILGFTHSTLSKGRVVDYLVEDELGTVWPLIEVKKVPYKGSSQVDLIVTAGVEKIFSLLVEKNLILKMVGL
jgi:alanyl-tRNA synthetase